MNKFKPLNYKNIALQVMALAISMGMLLSSCKKTELVPFEAEASNRITAYTVTNAQEAVNGIVDHVDNTITVYVPYYISIDFIVPVIKLADGATLIDNDGNSIDIRENLDPVPFDTVGYKYRVKDDKNNIRSYTLITKIMPFKDELKLGYSTLRDENGNVIADDKTVKEAIINSRFGIYGNLESSSKNVKLMLVNKETNAVVPNALKVYEVGRNRETHYITADISADVESGMYYIIAEHQGRKDTLPDIHMNYKKPFFGFLPKPLTQGQEVTLKVNGVSNNGEYLGGVNTGVKRAYIKFQKHLYTKPASFPESLFDQEIEVEIVKQDRTSITIKIPETIPAGIYETNMGSGVSIDIGQFIEYTGFGLYFDFEDSTWGNGNLLSGIPYLAYEVKAKN